MINFSIFNSNFRIIKGKAEKTTITVGKINKWYIYVHIIGINKKKT